MSAANYRQSDYRSAQRSLDPARQATPALPAGKSIADFDVQVTELDKLLGFGAPASWVAGDLEQYSKVVGLDDSWFCGVECGSGPSGVKETIKSGYGMVTFNTEEILPFTIRGDAGVRYVHTDQYSFGYIPGRGTGRFQISDGRPACGGKPQL